MHFARSRRSLGRDRRGGNCQKQAPELLGLKSPEPKLKRAALVTVVPAPGFSKVVPEWLTGGGSLARFRPYIGYSVSSPYFCDLLDGCAAAREVQGYDTAVSRFSLHVKEIANRGQGDGIDRAAMECGVGGGCNGSCDRGLAGSKVERTAVSRTIGDNLHQSWSIRA